MLSKLKGMFAPKDGPGDVPELPPGPKPRSGRVNIAKRFSTIAETSQGSMSRVVKAVDNETGATVCLKVQTADKQEEAMARAHRDRPPEGEIGMRVVHPHVARTLEYGRSNRGENYVVMEYVDGVSLKYVRENLALNLRGKLKLLAQAADALAAVHAAGFIHHDINPRNLLVNRENQVKLIDFGLSVPNTPTFRRPGNRTGALEYMAPELIRREPKDERLDIFAFGALAFELLTNRLPYEGGGTGNMMAMMLQRMNSDPLDPAQVAPHLPEDLCGLLRKVLARKKEDRWPSMATLSAGIEAIRVAEHARRAADKGEPPRA